MYEYWRQIASKEAATTLPTSEVNQNAIKQY